MTKYDPQTQMAAPPAPGDTQQIQPQYEMTMDHFSYDREYLDQFLPEDIVYITSLRHPYSRLKSALYFRGLYKALEGSTLHPVGRFLDMPEVRLRDILKGKYLIFWPKRHFNGICTGSKSESWH